MRDSQAFLQGNFLRVPRIKSPGIRSKFVGNKLWYLTKEVKPLRKLNDKIKPASRILNSLSPFGSNLKLKSQ